MVIVFFLLISTLFHAQTGQSKSSFNFSSQECNDTAVEKQHRALLNKIAKISHYLWHCSYTTCGSHVILCRLKFDSDLNFLKRRVANMDANGAY